MVVQGGNPNIYAVYLQGSTANSYTGATTLQSGRLALSTGRRGGAFRLANHRQQRPFLETGTPQQINPTTPLHLDGTFQLDNQSQPIGALSGSGSGAIALGSGTLTVNALVASTFSGEISGTGNLEKTGPATLTLNGNLDYTGNTTVSAGLLIAGNLLHSKNVTVNGNARLQCQSLVANTLTIGGDFQFSLPSLAGGVSSGTPTPEPNTCLLLLLGALGWIGFRSAKRTLPQ